MARRKKNMTYEEELTYLDSEISKTEETLKALKTRKKELAKVKEQADLQTLYAAGASTVWFPVFSFLHFPFSAVPIP